MHAHDFEAHRARLTAIAARILGTGGDVDDVVQEAWLRYRRTDGVDDPAAWLTTVVTRLCLDRLRKQRTRGAAEEAAGAAAVVTTPGPETDAVTADQVGAALHVVVDALVPAERTAFVLHDVFGYAFANIGVMLGRSDAAVRQLASRARRKVRGVAEPAIDRETAAHNREIVDAFLAAAQSGRVADLLALLDPDAAMYADLAGQAMGTEPVYRGAAAVADRFRGAKAATRVSIDGDPGVAWLVGGAAKVAFLFHVEASRVTMIELIADPEALATMEIVRGAARR